MSKVAKIWLIVASSLVVAGIIIFGAVMSILKWDFLKLSTAKYERNSYEIAESFHNISINTDTADVAFLLSEDGQCKVVCHENEKEKHQVTVQNDTLVINNTNNKKWYDHIHIGINFETTKITVYLPASEYRSLNIKESTGDVEISENFKFENIDIIASTGDIKNFASVSDSLKIKTSTGKINVSGISAGSIDLSVTTGNIEASDIKCEGDVNIKVSTGKTKLTNVECENIISNGTTGDIILNNVISSGKISIERDTGDLKFDSCDAKEIRVVTDTGDVKGSLLSEKVFVVHTDTGRKDVPKTTSGGICEITTDTGDIIINIK